MKKIMSFFFIIILVIELSMQLTSFGVQSWMSFSRRSVKNGNAKFKILCIGESTTAWGGAYSYPAILERELDKLTGPGTFEVINAGIPGTSTRAILSQIPKWIAETKPDIAIIMAGVNDVWSLPDNGTEPWERSLEWISQYSRTAKMIRITIINSKHQNTDIGQPAGMSCEMKMQSGQIVQSKLTDDIVEADAIFQERGYQKTVEFLERKIKKLSRIGYCIDAYPRQIKIIDYQRNVLKNPELALLTVETILKSDVVPSIRHKFVELKNILNAQLGLAPEDEKYPDGSNYWENSSYKINIQKIMSYFQGHKIPVIAMQYPRLPIAPLKKIIIDHRGIVYLENKNNFEKVLKQKKMNEIFYDLFGVVFGHTTPLGSQIIATNAAMAVLDLIPLK